MRCCLKFSTTLFSLSFLCLLLSSRHYGCVIKFKETLWLPLLSVQNAGFPYFRLIKPPILPGNAPYFVWKCSLFWPLYIKLCPLWKCGQYALGWRTASNSAQWAVLNIVYNSAIQCHSVTQCHAVPQNHFILNRFFFFHIPKKAANLKCHSIFQLDVSIRYCVSNIQGETFNWYQSQFSKVPWKLILNFS